MTVKYIYKTTNLINGKIYVGQRRGDVINDKYIGSGIAMKCAIKKYGRDKFKKEILVAGINNQKLLDELERHYIQLYASYVKSVGYNLAKGGGGMYGIKHSDEAKMKLSIANKGYKHTDEAKR